MSDKKDQEKKGPEKKGPEKKGPEKNDQEKNDQEKKFIDQHIQGQHDPKKAKNHVGPFHQTKLRSLSGVDDEGNRIEGDRIRGRNTDQTDGYEEKFMVTEDMQFQGTGKKNMGESGTGQFAVTAKKMKTDAKPVHLNGPAERKEGTTNQYIIKHQGEDKLVQEASTSETAQMDGLGSNDGESSETTVTMQICEDVEWEDDHAGSGAQRMHRKRQSQDPR